MILCPRCETKSISGNPASNSLSRRDNKTLICNDCGTEEAFVDARLIDLEQNPFVLERENRMRKIAGVKELKP